MHARQSTALAVLLICCISSLPSALAQQAAPETVAELRAELAALRVEQTERDRRIQRLEDALERIAGAENNATADTKGTASYAAPASVAAVAPPSAVTPAATADTLASRLEISGDLRLRGQGDWSDDDGKSRTSTQLRGRLGAKFALNERITIGARLATGDGDDPNSTDVQLSNWLNDLEVSLDMAYAQFNFGELTLYGGKMPQPFVRTELVWDGDVNPQGVAAIWRKPTAGGGTLRVNSLASIIDEDAAGPDSTLFGTQVGYESAQRGQWKFDVHGAWYQYDLGSIVTADEGDLRSNLRDANGDYLSEFRLANVLFGATYAGFGERWPLRLVADYVHNTGAATDADTGYGADLILGKASAPGDWRFTYGYSMAQTDAVLAAFSHDNIGIATNYRLHGLTIDYVPMPKTMISAIWYHYRPFSALDAGANQPGDWLDRLRLAFLINF